MWAWPMTLKALHNNMVYFYFIFIHVIGAALAEIFGFYELSNLRF